MADRALKRMNLLKTHGAPWVENWPWLKGLFLKYLSPYDQDYAPIAGLWWKRANRVGGVAAALVGATIYVLAYFEVVATGLAPVVVALAGSALAMLTGGLLARPDPAQMLERIAALHDEGAG